MRIRVLLPAVAVLGGAALLIFGQTASTSSRSAAVAGVYRLVAPGAGPTPSPAGVTALQHAATASKSRGHGWLVGFAKRSDDPRPSDLAAGVHLGGYGLGPTRTTTGPLIDEDGTVEHIYSRALAISNKRGQTLLLADIENQGTFAADKQGEFGIWDMRQQVSHDTGVPVADIVINSDHSHAGPDLIGLWGGVPVAYLQYVYSETVAALDAAYAGRVEADLEVGTDTPVMPDPATGGYIAGTATPGETFDHSQFGPDSLTSYPDDKVDTQLRVLQAYDDSGHPLGTLINYAAHATVMGGGNVLYSADWPGRVALATEQALGEPVAVTMPADVGRTQPPRPCSKDCSDVDKLDTWTRLFTPWVLQSVAGAAPVRGDQVASEEVMTREEGTNGALIGVGYTGEAPVRGFGAYRSVTPPWFNGTVVGTFVSAHRIGDLLLTADPGEAYPDIRFALLTAFKSPPQAAFTFGLANDQLGYLIAPASEYPWITGDPNTVGNDNAFFNVSAQYGDHIYCTQVAEAQALGFGLSPVAQAYGPDAAPPVCPVESAGDAVPMGPAPQQPWPFGDGQNVTIPGQ